MDEKSKRRGKEERALLFPRIWQGIEAHRLKGSRVAWVVGKVGKVRYALVCVYASVNARLGKGRKMEKFWNNVNRYAMKTERGSRITVFKDMNGRVRKSEV